MNLHRPLGKSEPRISEEERQRRLDATDFARGSVRLEGFVLSEEVERLTQRYVDGELTSDEFTTMTLALAGVTD